MLKAHETAEEKVLRPVTQKTAGPEVADARTAEEGKADQALADLTALGVVSADFTKKFAAFMEAVADHAEAEEHQEHPTVLASKSVEERIDLGKAFLEEFERAGGISYPGFPDKSGLPAAR